MNADPETLIRKNADMVYRIALLHMKSREDAEDIFQDVFLRMMEHLDEVEDEGHLKFWLIRVTINCCNTYFSSAWKRKVIPVEAIPEDTKDGGIEEKADRSVYDAVKGLPGKYRTAIHLFYFEELTVSEIAGLLKCRAGTVKSILSRGRGRLRKALREEGYHE